MEDTLGSATRAVNMKKVELLLEQLSNLLPLVQAIAEKVLASDHLFEPPRTTARGDRDQLEARAIVLVATMDNPTIGSISKALGVPKSTLRNWTHFRDAIDKRLGHAREPKRGTVSSDGSVDGVV